MPRRPRRRPGPVRHASLLHPAAAVPSYTGTRPAAHSGARDRPARRLEVPIVYFYELHEGDNEVFTDVLARPRGRDGARRVLRARPVDPPPRPGQLRATIPSSRRSPSSSSATTASSPSPTTASTAAVNVSTDEEENFLADRGRARRTTEETTTTIDADPRRGPDEAGRPTPIARARPGGPPDLGSAAEQDLEHVAVARRGRSCPPSGAGRPCAPRPSSRASSRSS